MEEGTAMHKLKQHRNDMGMSYWGFITVPLVIYCVFSLLPFVYTIYYSFTDYSDIKPTGLSFVALKNYKKVFEDPIMRTALKNSVFYALTLTFAQVTLALPLAVILNSRFRSRNFVRAIFFAPAVFSALVVGYLWNYIMSSADSGLINSFMHQLGLPTINFFGGQNALLSVILTQVWQWTGWGMVIFLANLQSIPNDYYEAAEIDGVNTLSRFFRITLPLMCPSMKIVVITGLIGGMKVFDIIYAMTEGGPGYTTETIMTTMVKKGVSKGFYAQGSAFGVIFFLIVLAITGFMNSAMKKWSEAVE